MDNLTFGEQVKIILGRKGMTIKELAEHIEKETGKKMSRQNLTQRLGRDNFQEQDMRMIANILGCTLHLSILANTAAQAVSVPDSPQQPTEQELMKLEHKKKLKEMNAVRKQEAVREAEIETNTVTEAAAEVPNSSEERDMTIGEVYKLHEELNELEETANAEETPEVKERKAEEPRDAAKERLKTGGIFLRKKAEKEGEKVAREVRGSFEPVITHKDIEEDLEKGEINPYTGKEYQTNSVRMHPQRIGYVQVYDRSGHKWTDMTEWAFLGYQERKKALLGKEYEPPIYLD